MFTPLGDFLSKFKIPPRRGAVEQGAAELISQMCDVAVAGDEVRLRGGVLYLAVPPVVRSEILLKREFLMPALREKFKDTVRDIR